MSPGDALTGKGHVRYSTGLADRQEADQRSPTSSCAQNSQICTALVLIGIEPAPAQNGGYSRAYHVVSVPAIMGVHGTIVSVACIFMQAILSENTRSCRIGRTPGQARSRRLGRIVRPHIDGHLAHHDL